MVIIQVFFQSWGVKTYVKTGLVLIWSLIVIGLVFFGDRHLDIQNFDQNLDAPLGASFKLNLW